MIVDELNSGPMPPDLTTGPEVSGWIVKLCVADAGAKEPSPGCVTVTEHLPAATILANASSFRESTMQVSGVFER